MSDRARRPFWHLGRRRPTVAADVDEELAAHLDLRAAELQARGLSPEDARREAARRFGDLEGTRSYCREQDLTKEGRTARALELADIGADLRIAARGLLRAKGITAVIVATVGLGIGATTVSFSAVHASLLRPLPYRDPERLVRVFTHAPPNRFRFSVVDYRAASEQQTRFESFGAYSERSMAWSDGAGAERLRGRVVTWTYFDVLGLRPALGRSFLASEGRPGAPAVVIVSDGFWRARMGARPDAIGSAVRLDGREHVVVGVLPRVVGPLEQGQEFFVPAQWDVPRRRGPFFILAIARLKGGVSREEASAELQAINRKVFPLWRESYQNEAATWDVMDLNAHVVGESARPATVALGAVALVWLIACANASNLLVARVASRKRELAVRAALGASRARVLRHLLAESALLAGASAAVGIAIAAGGIRLLLVRAAGAVPRIEEAALDGPVLAVLAAVAAASAIVFALVPALHGSGGPIEETLKALGRSATAGVSVRRARRVLVGAQFAIAMPLLVSAALLLASLDALGRVDLGFDGAHLLSGSLSLPAASYADPARVATFWEEAERRMESAPGVAAVAFADGRAPADVQNFNNFDLEDAPAKGGAQPVTPWVAVSRDYFEVMGLSLLEGRLFDEHDGTVQGVNTVVVDRAWAARFFPGGSAVGRRLRGGGCTTCPWTVVVGVVGAVKYAGLDQPDQGTVYTPLVTRTQAGPADPPSRLLYAIVRTTTEPASAIPALRAAIREVDPAIPLAAVATVEDLVDRALQRPRSLSTLVAGFALVALALSVIGIFGVVAFYVQQHGREISIRVALGGRAQDVLRLVVGQGMKVVAAGTAIGLLAAVAAARLMSGLLFGAGSSAAAACGAVAALLLGVALVACLVPARRALAVPPAALLRSE
jgi:predicted permease